MQIKTYVILESKHCLDVDKKEVGTDVLTVRVWIATSFLWCTDSKFLYEHFFLDQENLEPSAVMGMFYISIVQYGSHWLLHFNSHLAIKQLKCG